MNNTMMMLCMVAVALFALIVMATQIIQTILQAKILREVQRLKEQFHDQTKPTDG
ncbi:MAG: hypothetical protein KY445_00885 [Armatimonadetes bacterium]|nr:hypothetical protein [Armatimonadota bacterium]